LVSLKTFSELVRSQSLEAVVAVIFSTANNCTQAPFSVLLSLFFGLELGVECNLDVHESSRAHESVADDETADSDLREHELDQLAAARLHPLAGVHL
jgi:hypothetical protein